ncbi:anaerobic ribonucleoside-triphosphate reductase-activating protein [Sulfuriroseicoccus oceanibius]|uniref:Anaerobic ribonucleoside-triphosphate reductase-activating protein n=1 Tax=Sulfuriroseicoccus oceanibius TaxID=2707525 RepID=A0A6B3L9N4_9BACT|nr:anaerobic ribonucleoside-triphosphate reductase-activating protein [Sulfuriroseicoccus oceanibius]QQL45681.1 anaerobic ribonucleoside-triphosphate reductase-activating protein [Sulfuriroseicoccus oceanibius]
MNYHRYIDVDVVNGPGTRCTLYVAGCEHHCPGCYNASTWPLNSGHPFCDALADQIVADLNDTRIRRRGLSLTGGDPLHPENVPEVLKLVRRVRAECPGKDVWMWTGYTFEALTSAQRELAQMVDVLVDGRFVQELADPELLFRGSSNQRLIEVGKV